MSTLKTNNLQPLGTTIAINGGVTLGGNLHVSGGVSAGGQIRSLIGTTSGSTNATLATKSYVDDLTRIGTSVNFLMEFASDYPAPGLFGFTKGGSSNSVSFAPGNWSGNFFVSGNSGTIVNRQFVSGLAGAQSIGNFDANNRYAYFSLTRVS